MPSSAGGNIPSLNSDDTSNGGGGGGGSGGGGAGGAAGEHLNNNNEVCDVPDDVANQKRHVSVHASQLTPQLDRLSGWWVALRATTKKKITYVSHYHFPLYFSGRVWYRCV